ncbi:protein phosphatase 2C domain-containing protein [Rhodobacteraceae bacterium B1Z28]|uniref:Protein phosphatase 2C domain-containing protein n=1 Tax=Ruegeria haliotis TaxID=2747601 RepID=A0ABX2PWM0_9RHOB|nr:protein phosphatase 2C domain-containing protein [Ruegeria haliotis]NVO58618.1 protein phosphatase 2C domain-containing protein [Ruegeria haliotis]
MHFETLQSISLNGDPNKPNDDRFGSTSTLAWVIDGATDLGKPGLLGQQGGASWLASTANAAFSMTQEDQIHTTCQTVFERIDAQFHHQRSRDVIADWEIPKAAFAATQIVDGTLEFAWAADCPILHKSGNKINWCTGEPDASAEVSEAKALGEGIGAAHEMSGAVLSDRRAHRARANQIALSALAGASAGVTRFSSFPISSGDELILMSDGFASLVSDYARYTGRSLIEAVRARGLADLMIELRRIERADAACLNYPRFKASDDATALWLRVAG